MFFVYVFVFGGEMMVVGFVRRRVSRDEERGVGGVVEEF